MIESKDLTQDSCRQALLEVLDSETLRQSDQLRKILQYICEATLDGNGSQVTESAIAIDVLNRLPSSSTGDDSSVRSRVYTLRRKLAHYYEIENPSSEICIEIPKGGYIPRFFVRAKPGGLQKAPHKISRLLPAVGTIVACVALVALFAYHFHRSDRLGIWAPLIDSGDAPILVVVGAGQFLPASAATHGSDTQNPLAPQNYGNYKVDRLGTGDARALFHLGSLFGQLHVNSRLRLNAATSLEDLHRSPTVLLSAFNNQFTLKTTSDLRYRFASYDRFSGQIEDSRQPTSQWHLNLTPEGQISEDFGIAARLMGQPSQEPIVIAAGLEQCGTEASLSLLTDFQQQLIQQMPAGWEHKNFEAVVGVNVVNGSCGTPSIVRLEVW